MTEPAPQSDAPVTTVPAPTVTFFKRSTKNRSSIRKRPTTPPPATTSDSSDAYSSSDEKATGTRCVKKRRKNKSVVTTETTSRPSSTTLRDSEDVKRRYTDMSSELTNANDATKTNWHNHGDNEMSSLSSSKKNIVEGEEEPIVGGTYKGTSSYTSFIKKSENAPARSVGPMKAPSNIRTITITDYAPDVCKDYKQTGFCGFGDTCKFLHAREDYAQGWKLDRDWEIDQKTGKAKNKKGDDSKGEDDEEKELKDIPFKCIICKGDYKSPIVTKCKHYFCEACAIARYKKTPNCEICGKRTDGAFSMAKELRKKLERKAVREEERRKKEEEEAMIAESN
ncbi:hypothetical protein HOY80DRAFT_981741 [Tuber brumale]|nr:hypothetical protein HOY80DRAFT_981741 [Tuber brumale]